MLGMTSLAYAQTNNTQKQVDKKQIPAQTNTKQDKIIERKPLRQQVNEARNRAGVPRRFSR